MPLNMSSPEPVVSASRRTVVKAAAKLAYAAPLVVTTMRLDAGSAGAVSGPIAGCGSYVLANPSGGCIFVDDDLEISVNGTPVYVDSDVFWSCDGPVSFNATPGAQLRIVATDSYGICRSLDPITLFCADGSASQALTAGVSTVCDDAPGTTTPFFDETYIIAI